MKKVTYILFSLIASGVFWPIANVNFGVKMKPIGTVLFVPPNTIRTSVKGIAHTRDRINSVFAVFWLVGTLNLGKLLVSFNKGLLYLMSKTPHKNFLTKLPQRDAHIVLFCPRKGEVRDIPGSQIGDLYLKISIFSKD